ncbi:MAG: carboxymuconolactone decarboxylase family protein [Dehalococcoidia bacterium]
MLRRESDDPDLANHVMHGEDDPSLGPQEQAMVAYARRLTREPAAMTPADLDALRTTGLSEEQVLNVVLIACLFNFMTRLADGLGVEVEPQKAALAAKWLQQRPGSEWEFLRVSTPLDE